MKMRIDHKAFKAAGIPGGRRAQAALEYLTTYGWAILVITVSISALVYFGVFNPAKFVPESCNTDTNFRCVQYAISGKDESAEVSVLIQLSCEQSKPVYFDSLKCIFPDGTETEGVVVGETEEEWRPNREMEFECVAKPEGVTRGQKAKVRFEITYSLVEDGYLHTSSGALVANVQ